jgi:hypothetical protein
MKLSLATPRVRICAVPHEKGLPPAAAFADFGHMQSLEGAEPRITNRSGSDSNFARRQATTPTAGIGSVHSDQRKRLPLRQAKRPTASACLTRTHELSRVLFEAFRTRTVGRIQGFNKKLRRARCQCRPKWVRPQWR